MKTLRNRQEEQSVAAMRGIRIVPQDEVRIGIRVKAIGAFSPLALDGIVAELELSAPDAAPIRGRLSLLPADAPRGLWFHYAFIPDDLGALASIVFNGECHWSNVAAIVFCGAEVTRAKNPFRRAAA